MKLFVTAGEPSGDALGAALIEGLRAQADALSLKGVAGPRMEAAGMESLFPMNELSVMGIAEILPKYRHLMRRINETAEACIAAKPAALVTIDSPDFSLRVARRVKEKAPHIKTIHYVAPTVWAWRPKRAAKMARTIDHVLALFPFEPPYLTREGMGCDFVGHPVVALSPVSDAKKSAFRNAYGVPDGPSLVCLPGSRKSEVERLLPIFGASIARSQLRDWPILLPTLPHLVPVIERLASALPTPPHIIAGSDLSPDDAAQERRTAMASAALALAASGTVSLELAAVETPMVIAYDMNWLTRQIIQRKLLIDTVTLVNLVSETRHVPEFIGRDCTPEKIASGLDRLAGNSADQAAAMARTMEQLGQGGDPPGHRAARAILHALEA